MPKIYCVEDDESIRELIIYALKNSGFEAEGFEEGKEFFLRLNSSKPDLVILDLMLPGDDGLTILKRIREDINTQELPVIILTAKSTEYDKVKGLDMGSDDYITKPFGVMELISRIKAVLRRTSTRQKEEVFSLDGVSLDYKKRIVTVDGIPVDLTYKEFELLYYLLKNREIVHTRESLMNQIWGFEFEGETRTVDVHIGTLRKKLGDYGGLIKTIRNVGYKVGDID